MPTPFDDIYSIEDKIKYINFLESDLDEDNYWQYKSLLEECANAGSEESVIKLSEIYRYGDNFTDQDKNAAIEILKVFFSKHKSANIAKNIAEISWYKFDDELDTEITNWYKISADLGDGEACYELAQRYQHGWGCKENLDNTIRYYELAIGYRYTSANIALAKLYLEDTKSTQNHKVAIKLLQDGSIQEDDDCQLLYSKYLELGDFVDQDEKQAFMWLTKSAMQENSEAQYRLANNYLTGIGVDKDIFTAVKWFEKSANNHFQRAQIQLYTCFLCGSGIEKNLTLAFAWLLIAIKNSKLNTSDNLKSILNPMSHELASTLNKNQIERAKKFRDEFISKSSYLYDK